MAKDVGEGVVAKRRREDKKEDSCQKLKPTMTAFRRHTEAGKEVQSGPKKGDGQEIRSRQQIVRFVHTILHFSDGKSSWAQRTGAGKKPFSGLLQGCYDVKIQRVPPKAGEPAPVPVQARYHKYPAGKRKGTSPGQLMPLDRPVADSRKTRKLSALGRSR